MYGFSDCGICAVLMESLVPVLNLQTQLEMECDRRAAARMSRDQLAIKTDELIQAWYHQHELINRMLGKIRQLQVQVALSGAPVLGEPTAEHHQWARELLGQP